MQQKFFYLRAAEVLRYGNLFLVLFSKSPYCGETKSLQIICYPFFATLIVPATERLISADNLFLFLELRLLEKNSTVEVISVCELNSFYLLVINARFCLPKQKGKYFSSHISIFSN